MEAARNRFRCVLAWDFVLDSLGDDGERLKILVREVRSRHQRILRRRRWQKTGRLSTPRSHVKTKAAPIQRKHILAKIRALLRLKSQRNHRNHLVDRIQLFGNVPLRKIPRHRFRRIEQPAMRLVRHIAVAFLRSSPVRRPAFLVQIRSRK